MNKFQERAVSYIRSGVTPRALETLLKETRNVREAGEVLERKGVSHETLLWLKGRWGVTKKG